MDWYQLITGVIAICGMLYFFINRFDGDIKQVNESIQALSNRLDSQGERTDRLYQMFVDLLKEGKK